ncbi:hypothetical protein M3Y97_01024300 [Aphelenchoides bicaudatus]|nr:hypothetical protein M3Y97_01024300 [Aphelenchoides bicaudatus]
MLIRNAPDIFHTRDKQSVHIFGKDGRFIFIYHKIPDDFPKFGVYDTKFNKHIELTVGSSIKSFKKASFNFLEKKFLSVRVVDPKHVLVAMTEPNEHSTLLALLSLNYQHSTYELVDTQVFEHCIQPAILNHGDKFGLFCSKECQDGRLRTNGSGNKLKVYVFNAFKLEENKIVKGDEKELKYNYHGPSPNHPMFPHLHNQKIWFLRRKDQTESGSPCLLNRFDDDFNLYIAFFDLTADYPAENWFGYVREDDKCNMCAKNRPVREYLHFQWTTESFLVQTSTDEFRLLDLNSLERVNLKSSIPFPNPFFSSGEHHFISFFLLGEYHPHSDFVYYSDDESVLTIIQCPDMVHRVPLKAPHKLMEIAWISALNSGQIPRLSKANLQYKPLF